MDDPTDGSADDRDSRILAVAALEEPTRRRLYDYVVRQAALVTRDEAAEAVRLPRTTAAFHLDRLVEQGLLEVVYERRTGRSGPGAGRPSKLYRRSAQQVEVSLPEHRYELAGQLLAAAIEDADASGESPRAALERRARQLGHDLATANPEADVEEILEDQGFEPRREGKAIVLGNCPFHALAKHHTELVCEMNLCLLGGILTGASDTRFQARIHPEPGQCCVRLER